MGKTSLSIPYYRITALVVSVIILVLLFLQQREMNIRKKAKEELENLVTELQTVLSEVKTLRGILPVCCVCGLIRDDTGVEHGKGEWMNFDKFVAHKTNAQVSHSYCPKCFDKEMGEDI